MEVGIGSLGGRRSRLRTERPLLAEPAPAAHDLSRLLLNQVGRGGVGDGGIGLLDVSKPARPRSSDPGSPDAQQRRDIRPPTTARLGHRSPGRLPAGARSLFTTFRAARAEGNRSVLLRATSLSKRRVEPGVSWAWAWKSSSRSGVNISPGATPVSRWRSVLPPARVEIAGGIHRPTQLLRRHVSERTDQGRAMGDAALQIPRSAEVDDPELPLEVPDQVGRLDVAVDDGRRAPVNRLQDLEDIAGDLQRRPLIDATLVAAARLSPDTNRCAR